MCGGVWEGTRGIGYRAKGSSRGIGVGVRVRKQGQGAKERVQGVLLRA